MGGCGAAYEGQDLWLARRCSNITIGTCAQHWGAGIKANFPLNRKPHLHFAWFQVPWFKQIRRMRRRCSGKGRRGRKRTLKGGRLEEGGKGGGRGQQQQSLKPWQFMLVFLVVGENLRWLTSNKQRFTWAWSPLWDSSVHGHFNPMVLGLRWHRTSVVWWCGWGLFTSWLSERKRRCQGLHIPFKSKYLKPNLLWWGSPPKRWFCAS